MTTTTYTPSLPSILLPTIITLTVLLILSLAFALWYRHRRYARLPSSDPEAIARLKEKSSVAEGAQVWFSRRIHRGSWEHWSLIIRDTRYELRRASSRDAESTGRPVVLRVEPCSLMSERKQAQADTSDLRYRGFYVTMVGWTRCADKEIRERAERALRAAMPIPAGGANGISGEELGPHASIHIQPPTPFTPGPQSARSARPGVPLTPVWEKSMESELELQNERTGTANTEAFLGGQRHAQTAPGVYEQACQEFLRELADAVCEERKAADWSWFRDNVTSYWRDVEVRLMAGPIDKKGGVRPRSQLPVFSSVDAGVRAWAYG